MVGQYAFGFQVAMEPEQLDPLFVFIVDIGMKIMIWYGQNCKSLTKSKTRSVTSTVVT